MIRRDWMSAVDTEQFETFLSERLGLFPDLVEKRFNRFYGTYFTVYLLKDNEEVVYFGNLGKLKQIKNNGKIMFIDDLDFLEENIVFKMEYLAFIHSQNKVDGIDKRIANRTFVEDYKIRLKNRVNLKEIKEKGDE